VKEQQSLFELEPAPWEADDASEELVASLVFATGPEGPFDYRVPDELRGKLVAGQRVHAPFGAANRLVLGYCVRVESKLAGKRRLKAVHDVADERPLLSPAMLKLTEWMADYYLCPWGQVLEAVVPAGVRAAAGTRITQFVRLPNHVAARLPQLKLSTLQKQIVTFLANQEGAVPLAQVVAAVGCTPAPIQNLHKKGLLELESRRFDAQQSVPAVRLPSQEHLQLNEDQRAALDAILAALHSRRHETLLIHGVTGSGKTEVYIQAIDEVIRFGRQAIVLVPEISLTPQTEARFRSRFGSVAVLHSNLRYA
jgi:primosomal protein N' (replication factor Y)